VILPNVNANIMAYASAVITDDGESSASSVTGMAMIGPSVNASDIITTLAPVTMVPG
jgi:hypothetical protein